MTEHSLLVEKYRPLTLDSFIGNESLKSKVGKFIATGDIPHLLFSGPAGTGKTTLAKIIVKNIDCDYLYINASDDNNVDTIRTRVKSFVSSIGFRNLKIVILDEADYITPNGQAALRNIMETFSQSGRFILTCNYVERLIDPIISRTQQFHIIPPNKIDVAKHVAGVLRQENITYAPNDVKLLVDAYYPDVRKTLNECQLHIDNSELKLDEEEIIEGDIKLKVIEVLAQKIDAKKKFQEIRQLVADNDVRDFSALYTLLYEKVDDYAAGHISQVILAINEGVKSDPIVVNKEINFMATIIQILQIIS